VVCSLDDFFAYSQASNFSSIVYAFLFRVGLPVFILVIARHTT